MSTRANHSPQLSPEATAARRAYRQEWNKRNAGKLKEYNRKYWERKGAEFRAARAAREQEEANNE